MKTIYAMAQLSMNVDGKTFLTWYGMHPDQGGMNERVGQLEFASFDDMIAAGIPLMIHHDTAEIWLRRIREKEQEKETALREAIQREVDKAKVDAPKDGSDPDTSYTGQD